MDVAVSDLRANLSHWLERVRNGDEVIVTERGVPVARILGVHASPLLERLTAAGVIGRPRSPGKPTASGRSRPTPRRPVAPLITDQRY